MFKKRKKKQIECSAESNLDTVPFHLHWKETLMGVKRKAAVTAAQRLTLEKEMLLSGKKPKSIFSSAQQRTAVRLLSGFFAMMLIFTILSRIATDLTIAKVRTDTVKPGVLVQSYTIPGTLEARGPADVVEIFNAWGTAAALQVLLEGHGMVKQLRALRLGQMFFLPGPLKQLLAENGLPDIRWHDLRSVYCMFPLKEAFNPKAVSELMVHAKGLITMDVYADNKGTMANGVPGTGEYMKEVLLGQREIESFKKELLGIVLDAKEYLPDTG